MTLALYRKYRSQSLDEVVGQSHVTDLLKRAIEQGRIAHAYLFTGPRGVGKTSIARILAYQLNDIKYSEGESHLDIIEIDAASNNGVEDIRDLRDKVQIAPVHAKKKVYIIDEVHMLSKPAFNALLKTLEEPPSHVVFILATTDVDKVPETIISRTQRFTFRRATKPAIVENLKRIAKAEKVKVAEDALEVIAEHSDGSFRDSVSLFDQLLSLTDDAGNMSKENVLNALGLADESRIDNLLMAASQGDIKSIDSQLRELENSGVPSRVIAWQLANLIRSRMATSPDLLPLLDKLADISKSTQPSIKLLTTLCLHAADTFNSSPPPKPAPEPQPELKPKEEAPKKTKEQSVPKTKAAPQPEKEQKSSKSKSDFEWKNFIEYVQKNHVAIHSVLAKCQHELNGTTLVLYTRTPFYKKKLDDSKYRAHINQSLEAIGCSGLEIETIPSMKPPKDSNAARVAAIMGGGEEVNLRG